MALLGTVLFFGGAIPCAILLDKDGYQEYGPLVCIVMAIAGLVCLGLAAG